MGDLTCLGDLSSLVSLNDLGVFEVLGGLGGLGDLSGLVGLKGWTVHSIGEFLQYRVYFVHIPIVNKEGIRIYNPYTTN